MKTNIRLVFSIFILLLQIRLCFGATDSSRITIVNKKAFIVSGSLLAAGLYSRIDNVPLNKYEFRNWRNRNFEDFHTSMDDYLQFAPVVFAYGLGVLPGAKSKSDFVNKSVLLAKSELLMVATVYPLKYMVADKRPDSDSKTSWPSGHTTQAFVAATFLHHEYKHISPWISVAAFTCAGSVAAMRVLNDRHWSADVMAGAGIGILVTHVAYMTHQYKWHNFKFLQDREMSFLPYYSGNSKGIFFSLSL